MGTCLMSDLSFPDDYPGGLVGYQGCGRIVLYLECNLYCFLDVYVSIYVATLLVDVFSQVLTQ